MSKQLHQLDFQALAANIGDVLDTHALDETLRPSLTADLLFVFAAFLDDRLGSNHHEGIYALADELLAGELDSPPVDSLACELQIRFHKGRKAELNLLASHRSNRAHLLFDLEMALGIRSLDEINAPIDSQARFLALLDKRQGIRLLETRGLDPAAGDRWKASEPPQSHPASLDQLAQMLLALR